MRTTDLWNLITAFFMTHLAAERNVSPRTVIAYRDGIKLLLRFAADQRNCNVAQLTILDLTPSVILDFLTHLEKVRRNSIRTRNARLAAIHCFFRYVLSREPKLGATSQRILAIPFRKTRSVVLGYLIESELKHLLAQVDRSVFYGERDYLLFALLYDTGARIEEILDARPNDFRSQRPAYLRVMGKGRKERLCPLLPQTARLLARFIKQQGSNLSEDGPILRNRRGERLTQHGARYLLKKYLTRARESMPSLRQRRISPHTIRHTKGMHLLQAGVPLIAIKDILGHADLKTTEVYVQADVEMKRRALQALGTPARVRRSNGRLSSDVLAWLDSL